MIQVLLGKWILKKGGVQVLLLVGDLMVKTTKSNKDDKMWKKVRPIILVSGQIDSDLNVGDKKIDKDKINNIFLSTLENFSIKHL